MMHIEKGRAPEELEVYKKTPGVNYRNMDTRVKKAIRLSLLEEQHWLCAYCMMPIDERKTHIEHYLPQSDDNGKSLDYENMLGVCDGGQTREDRKKGRASLTCDAHRKNQPMKVDPRDKKSMDSIYYDENCSVCSKDKDIDRDLNDALNLNGSCTPHRRAREQALAAYQRHVFTAQQAGITMDAAAMAKERDALLSEPHRIGYCGIIIWWINEHSAGFLTNP